MRRFALSGAVWMMSCLVVLAQESPPTPPYLEFVRGLRQRGFYDLADEYSAQLRQRPDVPETVRDWLQMEEAAAKLQLAALSTQEGERRRLMEEARSIYQAFVNDKAKAKSPALGEAYRQLAMVLADEGHGKVTEITYTADKTARADLAKYAVASFDQADKMFIQAEALWKAQLDSAKSAGERNTLLPLYLQTLLQHGRALLAKSILQERYLQQQAEAGKTRQQAAELFKSMFDFRKEHSLGWVGLAWYGVSQTGLNENERQNVFKLIETAKEPLAFEAKRIVGYFRIRDRYSPGLPGKERLALQSEIRTWLNIFASPKSPDFKVAYSSRESQHLRLILAMIIREDLQEMKPTARQSETGQKMVNQVLTLLGNDIEANPEFGSVARWVKFNTLRLSGRVTARRTEELNTPEELLLRASLEAEEIQDKLRALEDPKTPAAEKEKLQEQIRLHYSNLLSAARRAWQRAGPGISPGDLENLLRYLVSAYVEGQRDVYRAAVLLEYAAQEPRLSPAMARQSALGALTLYSGLVQGHRDNPAALAADVRRLQRVAELIVSRWPKEPEADTARFRLGFIYLAAGRYREALAQWEAVSPNSPFYPAACAEAGELAFRLHATQMAKEQKPLATPSPDLDKAIRLLQTALAAYQKSKPAPNSAEEVRYIQAVVFLADALAMLNKPDEALKYLQLVLLRAIKSELPASLAPGTSGRVVTLALRSYVQLKRMDEARQLLQELYRSGTQQDLGQGVLPILREMGTQLHEQIRILESRGPAAAKELEQTRHNFKTFLDDLSKDEKLPTEFRLWIVSSYQSIGGYESAAQLARQLRELAAKTMKNPPAPKPVSKPEEAAALAKAVEEAPRVYAQALYLEVDTLRLQARALKQQSDQKDKADALLKQAEKILQEGMKEGKLEKHPQYVALQILLLQEQELYSGPRGAIARWDQLRTALQPHLDRGGLIRRVYLEACYNLVYCKYQEAKRLPDEKQRQLAMRRTAELLATFWQEPELQPRFRQLLDDPEYKDLLAVWQEVRKSRGSSP